MSCPSAADAVSGAAGALDLLGACNEGWAETYALDCWISGLNVVDNQVFKDLTTRVIFIPHSKEPEVIECTLPKSPHEIVASSFFSKMQHDITQASEARSHINLTDINRHSTDQSQRLAALRFKYSGALFELIPSSRRFVLNSETFAFALRHRLGLNVGIGFDYNAKIADLLAKSKLADMYLHNAIRNAIASSAALGDLDIVIREPNQLWVDPMGSGAAVPDLAWRRAGITSGLDVHAHATITTNARTLIARIASADLKKKNGGGTIAALTAARATAERRRGRRRRRPAGRPPHPPRTRSFRQEEARRCPQRVHVRLRHRRRRRRPHLLPRRLHRVRRLVRLCQGYPPCHHPQGRRAHG